MMGGSPFYTDQAACDLPANQQRFEASISDVAKTSNFIPVMICASAVGLVGLLPLLILPFKQYSSANPSTSLTLRWMLGMSCGGLLANVCFHILPEIFDTIETSGLSWDSAASSLFGGIFVFFFVEKLSTLVVNSGHTREDVNGDSNACGCPHYKLVTVVLNVIVNGLDNVLHGAAVAAAFCSSTKTGIVTSIAIMAHEIPHELGDYAILVRSGISWSKAMSLQILTSSACLVGAGLGLYLDLTDTSSVILPFTAGGFLYIALVGVLPDILDGGPVWWCAFLDVLSVACGAILVVFFLNGLPAAISDEIVQFGNDLFILS
eukprot:m.12555 g.12555  ORF g.12555 m.12555 type:complete len:320 (+) comp4016_c0_seq1:83-1042(+)